MHSEFPGAHCPELPFRESAFLRRAAPPPAPVLPYACGARRVHADIAPLRVAVPPSLFQRLRFRLNSGSWRVVTHTNQTRSDEQSKYQPGVMRRHRACIAQFGRRPRCLQPHRVAIPCIDLIARLQPDWQPWKLTFECVSDLIRKRAYQFFEARGGQPGRELDDWPQAEHEIKHHLRTNWRCNPRVLSLLAAILTL